MARRLTAAALASLVLLATACSTMVVVPSPAQFVATKSPRMVWVTKTDNTVLALQSPQIIADTIGGFVKGDFIELPLSSVLSMRARHPAPRRTALLVSGLTLGGAVALAVALHSPHGAPPGVLECINIEPEECP